MVFVSPTASIIPGLWFKPSAFLMCINESQGSWSFFFCFSCVCIMCICVYAQFCLCVSACGGPGLVLGTIYFIHRSQTQVSPVWLVLLASFLWRAPILSSKIRTTERLSCLPGIYLGFWKPNLVLTNTASALTVSLAPRQCVLIGRLSFHSL